MRRAPPCRGPPRGPRRPARRPPCLAHATARTPLGVAIQRHGGQHRMHERAETLAGGALRPRARPRRSTSVRARPGRGGASPRPSPSPRAAGPRRRSCAGRRGAPPARWRACSFSRPRRRPSADSDARAAVRRRSDAEPECGGSHHTPTIRPSRGVRAGCAVPRMVRATRAVALEGRRPRRSGRHRVRRSGARVDRRGERERSSGAARLVQRSSVVADRRHHEQIARARRGDVGEAHAFVAIAARLLIAALQQLVRRAARDALGPQPPSGSTWRVGSRCAASPSDRRGSRPGTRGPWPGARS